jgi:hypothetical protein
MFEPPEGIGAFAVFFVIAAAIERFLEFVGPALEWALAKLRPNKKTKPEPEATRDLNVALADNGITRDDDEGDQKTPQQRAADSQAAVNARRVGRPRSVVLRVV